MPDCDARTQLEDANAQAIIDCLKDHEDAASRFSEASKKAEVLRAVHADFADRIDRIIRSYQGES